MRRESIHAYESSAGAGTQRHAHEQRFSLAELEKLCTLLRGRYAVITPGNAAAVVETLRAVAELMIWGDQVRALVTAVDA